MSFLTVDRKRLIDDQLKVIQVTATRSSKYSRGQSFFQ